MDAIPESSSVSPWREVATENCLLSAGTEGCGYQLLRAAEARNMSALQHCCACTHTMHPARAVSCSHLWIPGAHCDQPSGFPTQMDTTLR